MPAAAVIPAPIAYIKVVAVKKSEVGISGRSDRSASFRVCTLCRLQPSLRRTVLALSCWGGPHLYCEKIRVFPWWLWPE